MRFTEIFICDPKTKSGIINLIFFFSSYIATPASSWIDDYIDWSLAADSCCKVTKEQGFCPHTDSDCESCEIQQTERGLRPVPADFQRYVSFFLQDNPDETCAKAGHPT